MFFLCRRNGVDDDAPSKVLGKGLIQHRLLTRKSSENLNSRVLSHFMFHRLEVQVALKAVAVRVPMIFAVNEGTRYESV